MNMLTSMSVITTMNMLTTMSVITAMNMLTSMSVITATNIRMTMSVITATSIRMTRNTVTTTGYIMDMTMDRIVPAAVTIMIIITVTTMQTRCLQAGGKKRLRNIIKRN